MKQFVQDPKVKREIPDSHTDSKREIWRGEVVGGGERDLKGVGDGDEESGKSGETMDRGLGGGPSIISLSFQFFCFFFLWFIIISSFF